MAENKSKNKFKDVDSYIASQPFEVRPILETLRKTIKEAVPDAEEVISYQIPAFKYHGILIYFATFKKHYSILVRPVFLQVFKPELTAYKTSKSAINIPLDQPVPVGLVTRIVRYIASRNAEKAAPKPNIRRE